MMKIAVIGIGCYYPGAKNIKEFWENILSRRREFRRIPDQRLPLAQYYSENREDGDKTYGRRAALIDGFHFDWAKQCIPKAVFKSTDLAHWIALDTALAALADSGYTKESIPGEKTGVIVGNTLTGEITRSNLLRLRWPYVEKSVKRAGKEAGFSIKQLEELLHILENHYKSPFPAITEDSLAGGLSNTIAGRICNYLDLNGGGYTIDGACSSSLLAIADTMNRLSNLEIDLGIAGGVDISLDPFELIGFAKAKALTSEDMNVYDHNAQGFIPGEGAGFVILKRYNDAVKDQDYIYAVVNGWGISSDGKGGLIAPSAKGQSFAIQRAYQKSPYGMDQLDFIEGHGTGTKVGDVAELNGISLAMGEMPCEDLRSCGVTSVKSIIGHTKAAAGAAGFLKTVLAVNQRIIPPTAGCQTPHEVFQSTATSLYPVLKGEIRSQRETLTAGVTGAGFGGINCHVTLTSGDAPNGKLPLNLPVKALLASHQISELFVFEGESPRDLHQEITTFRSRIDGLSVGELADLAYSQSQSIRNHGWRAYIVAGDPEHLIHRTEELAATLAHRSANMDAGVTPVSTYGMIGRCESQPRIGFLFPGQGSQMLNSAEFILSRFEAIRRLSHQALQILHSDQKIKLLTHCYRPTDRVRTLEQRAQWETALANTKIAQPAICFSSFLWTRYLKQIGIEPCAVGGHSLGELAAFYAAGVLDESQLMALAVFRGDIMASTPEGCQGAMLGLGCSVDDARSLLIDKGLRQVTVANINTPTQTIVSGSKEEITRLIRYAQANQIISKILPVSNAFHSTMMADAARKLRLFVKEKITTRSPTIKLFSSVTGEIISDEVDPAVYLSEQVVSPVDFISMVEKMAPICDLMIEVGPKAVLSKCVSAILPGGRQLKCHPIEPFGGRDNFEALNYLVGACFVRGQNIRWDQFYHKRLIRPFVPSNQKSFIVNPCESVSGEELISEHLSRSSGRISEKEGFEDIEKYFDQRKDFILDVIKADIKAIFFKDRLSSAKLEEKLTEDASEIASKAVAIPEEGLSGTTLQNTIFKVVARFTGFEPSQLSQEHKLLDDLNLDSIKSASLVGNIAKELKVKKQIDPIQLTNASIGDLVAVFSTLQAPSPVREPLESADPEGTVMEMVAQFTGFEKSQLSREHKLLDDLNLDSIKSATLVSNIAKKMKVKKRIDPIQLANTAIGDLIAFFSRTGTTDAPAVISTGMSERGGLWIRNFTQSLRPNPQAASKSADSKFRLLLLYTPETRILCEGLKAIFKSQRQQVILAEGNDSHKDLFEGESYHLIVPIPAVPTVRNRVISFLMPLLSVNQHLLTAKSIVFLQLDHWVFSCRAFARTLHLEHPNLSIKVIEVASYANYRELGRTILAELSTRNPISVVVYDESFVRYEPFMQLSDRSAYALRGLTWGSNDTLLVTGGAKGITKACAMAFAAQTCARLAVLGRSPVTDDAVSNLLFQTEEVGIRCRYYSCDITRMDALRGCVKTIVKEMGAITGVIHGAGLNQPRSIAQLSAQDAYAEIAPKLIGALNLMEIFNTAPPKIFAAFSSIIGITGMPGNAAYGFANEALSHLLRQFKQENPNTHIISLAYSIWGEIGMGVDMGSADFLASKGILAIPTEAGVARFLELMEKQAESDEVVISANLGNYLDTFRMAGHRPPISHRFLEDIRSYLPGVEVKVRARLNLKQDDYLKDHQWRGSYMFPTVFGLEAMAQAVALVSGRASLLPVVLTDISLTRPIVVDNDGEKGIEITALVRDRTPSQPQLIVDAWISTEDSDYHIKHFSASFNLESNLPEMRKMKLSDSDAPLTINPRRDLYGWLLFQGEQFQRIQRLHRLTASQAVFDTHERSRSYLLGDPFCRDTMLHAVQLPIPKDICLPVEIAKLTIFDEDRQGLLTGQATIKDKSDTHYLAEVHLCNDKENLVESLSGYKLKILEHHADHPTAAAMVDPGPYNDHQLSQAVQKLEKALPYQSAFMRIFSLPGVDDLPPVLRHEQEAPLIQKALEAYFSNRPEIDPGDLSLVRDAAGKPFIKGPVEDDISLSHDNGVLLAVLDRRRMGCDLQSIVDRSDAEWQQILTPARMPLVAELAEKDPHLNFAATRLWTVLEALQKIDHSTLDEPIRIIQRQDEMVVFEASSGASALQIATWPLSLALGGLRIAAVRVTPNGEVFHQLEREAGHGFSGEQTLSGPQNQAVFAMRQPLSFKDTGNPGKGVYFSNYFMWMGKVRELPLNPVYDDLVPQFISGKWGLVTNHSKITYVDEAASQDIMETKTWIGPDTFNNRASFPLCYEWHKIMPNGEKRLVAVGEQSTSWVEIVGHGLVELRPTPVYLDDFFKRTHMLPQNDKPYKPPVDLRSPLSVADWGEKIYTAPAGPQIVPSLADVTFQTTLEDANLVGNVYFANYPIWQGRVRDQFFFGLVPQFYNGQRHRGELFCVESRVDHLREAMPFDQVVVQMSLKNLFTNGICLWFDYYRKNGSGELEKLATGHHKALWVTHGIGQMLTASPLPAEIREALCCRIECQSNVRAKDNSYLKVAI